MHHMRQGNPKRQAFLETVLYLCLHSHPELQFFVLVYGTGGAGKSVFSALASALVGDDNTDVTSLRALTSDQFEALNLEGKKLILINDSEGYTKHLSPLKAVTGGDSLRGRGMHKQGTKEVRWRGIIIITAKQLLSIRDSSGAIKRRIRPYNVPKPPAKADNSQLLSKDQNGNWGGDLVEELPAI